MTPAEPSTKAATGRPLDRVDGRLKVTGGARYAAEFSSDGMSHGALVLSTQSKGRIRALDSTAALASPGVVTVLTSQNMPKLGEMKSDFLRGGGRTEERNPLSDDEIIYGGQIIAVVIAGTFEQAAHAAALVRVDYAVDAPALTIDDARSTAAQPKLFNGMEELQVHVGDVGKALAAPGVTIVDETYTTPVETHNPIEPAATLAVWDAPDKLTIYNATQWIKGDQAIVSQAFKLPAENVRVICPFVGGGFGCKGSSWPHTILAAAAAKVAGRPVKLPLTRAQMFTTLGHRPQTVQKVTVGAGADGKLGLIRHQTETVTSYAGEFIEPCGLGTTKVLYASPSIEVAHTVYKTNVAQPTYMRAPGESPGTFAVESAMDELAHALKIDPVELRVRNHADSHPVTGKPWSGKHLKECYQIGSERFGWSRRNPEPRSMRDGNLLVGWGMATATYPGYAFIGSARAVLKADGTAQVTSATHDLGTGAYTAFTQISADALGVPVEKVSFQLGDSNFPHAPVAGGSNSTATVGQAIHEAAKALHAKLIGAAVADPKSALYGLNADAVMPDNQAGRLVAKGDSSKADSFVEILRRSGQESIEAVGTTAPGEDGKKWAFQSFGAQFCEVKIDPTLPRVRVTRFVSVMDNGRVINPKTSRSQVIGGVIMGLGMALMEETSYDPTVGLPVTRNLADYHVCTNADVPEIETHFIDEPDMNFNAMGARGIGEIGITGVAAAVANAVFHATGVRVRDLPITMDKLLVV